MEFLHVPVMLGEVLEGFGFSGRNGLITDQSPVYIDATFGGGGHSGEILKRLPENGRLIGFDRDSDAIENAKIKFADEIASGKLTLFHENFCNMKKVLPADLKADGILADLGTSSHMLDDAERGFSYMLDAPLDMRMDRRQELTASDVVNGYPKEELTRILTEYGEERWASRIASFIVSARENKKIETTGELSDIIKAAIPAKARQGGPHPAKRSFQAIRIEVNGELEILSRAVEDMASLLRRPETDADGEITVPGGRLQIITFHSLEDRLVKQAFQKLENPCTCPKEFPVCMCGKKPTVKIITRKPIAPGNEELENNPRSRSAKLRIAEKI